VSGSHANAQPAKSCVTADASVRCPSCGALGMEFEEGFHLHLMVCVQSTSSRPKSEDLAPAVKGTIETITKLDLRSRISIMQALYRLSRATRSGGYLISPTVEAEDRKALNLLYAPSKKDKSSVRTRLRPPDLEIPQAPRKRKFRPLSSTSTAYTIYKPEPNDEFSDSSSAYTASPDSSPILDPILEKMYPEVPKLKRSRKDVDEEMIRRVVRLIEPRF